MSGVFLFSANGVEATTYYVDADITDTNVASATPDCTNYDPSTYTCSGGSASAYKTIADINAGSFNPGDNVYFKKGEVWRESLTVPSSGSSGNPITFGSYGSGEKPIISGYDVVTGVSGDWTDLGGNIWRKNIGSTTTKAVLFNSANLGIKNATPVAQYEWRYTSPNLDVYSIGNPTSYYSSIEANQRNVTITTNSKNYITFDGIISVGGQRGSMSKNPSGVIAWLGSNIIFQNCEVKLSHANGISIRGTDTTLINNCTISDINRQEDTGDGWPIMLTFEEDTSTQPINVTIQNSTITGYAKSQAIAIIDAKDFIIDNVTISTTAGSVGIDMEPNSGLPQDVTNGIIRNSYIVKANGTSHGIYATSPTEGQIKNIDIYNNIIDMSNNPTMDGIALSFVSTNSVNNIHNNQIIGALIGVEIGSSRNSGTNNIYKNNITITAGGGTERGIYISSATNNTWANIIDMNGGDRGIETVGGTNNLYNNTVLDSVVYGIRNTSNSTFQNNIFNSSGALHVLDTGVGTGNYDNNIYFPATGSKFRLDPNSTTNFSGWQTNLGSCPNGYNDCSSLTSDPSFLNSSGSYSQASDFQLQPTSPAIDSGTTISSLTTDYAGNPIYGLPDIGGYEYQPPYTFSSYNIPTTGSVRLYSDGKYRMKTATTTLSTGSFSVTPLGGSYYTASTSQYMDITVDTWQTTGNKNKQWTATSTAGSGLTQATSTIYTIGDLAANSYYQFKLDGSASTTAITGVTCNSNGTCLTDSSGNLTFTYVGGYSTHIFGLEKDVTAPAAFTLTSPTNNSSGTKTDMDWTASSDPESNFAKYQLYIDGTLDTDNIPSSTTAVVPQRDLTCGSHTWYVKAVDNAGNSTDSDTFTYTINCLSSGQKIRPLSSSSSSSSSSINQTNEISVLSKSNQFPTYLFSRQLSYGSRGTDVTELQKCLTSEGVYSGPITGFYGPMTREGVRKYQAKNNLSQVGAVGPRTLQLLNSSSSNTSSTSSSQGISLADLVETLINLGVITPDKAEIARMAITTINNN